MAAFVVGAVWPSETSAASDVLSFVARVPLLGDEHPMPSQDRIRREQRADFLETFATENLALGCQTAPLVVVEQDAFLAQLLFQHLVFGPQVLDHLLLLAAHPAGKNHQEQLP